MSSFQKIINNNITVSGVKTSVRNGQYIVSSGCSYLDQILGGGLPLGCVCLVEEDKYVTYSKVLSKYFIAESVLHKHSILLTSLDENPKDMIKKVPVAIKDDNKSNKTTDTNPSSTTDEMRIAWRYNSLPKFDSSESESNNHYFDLTNQLTADNINELDIHYLPCDNDDINDYPNEPDIYGFTNKIYYRFLIKLKNLLKSNLYEISSITSDKIKSKILKISINSLGSPLWFNDEAFALDLCKFLSILRNISENHLIVCFITMPMHLIESYDQTLPHRIRNLVHYAIELESFAGSDKETNPIFKEYHGLLYVRKLSALHTLATYSPETMDLAFKLRRKRFVIEKLHLPPELQEIEDSTKSKSVNSQASAAIGCGSTTKHLLEF